MTGPDGGGGALSVLQPSGELLASQEESAEGGWAPTKLSNKTACQCTYFFFYLERPDQENFLFLIPSLINFLGKKQHHLETQVTLLLLL